MAAADYYTSNTRPAYQQQNSGLQPPLGPQRASSQPTFSFQPPPQTGTPPHPQYPQPQHPPPPYQQIYSNNEPEPRVHFAPTPSPLGQQRPSPPHQSRPEPYAMNQPNYQASPAHQLAPYQQQYIPQNYKDQYQLQPQPQPQPQPQHRPYIPPRHAIGELVGQNGYVSDPERHRRKHRERSRRTSDNSRSTKADAFLGAAGGGLLGDLIFPGLGTVGGALVGWVGGKDYGKHRKWREDKRDRDQDRWERKYGSDRSRSHSQDRRRSSHERSERERRHSHDHRRNYD
ncbi:uncharacterized protein A1O9_05230 [Exophiala aquamarina CBS 119918]|uniref:Glycine zipper 2TM domain-containing protein n=1 Tax=Exophiala aquamarina CBS 119918 TaxID=1182545 RepID=A0A072PDG3_9EURO|nr:uncharacterized protein A1O9_05230 [Exophiala aquamarina CBS 119918]KEF57313.1 hypothetical protein A1O9_05230 [Exophiala aquamarina CBS 119918]